MPLAPYKPNLDPETLELAQEVFDTAWADVTSLPAGYDRQAFQDLIAKRIVAAAVENRERNPDRLKAFALAGFDQ